RIIAIHFPMAGFNVISSSAFQALGRGTLALLVSVIRQLVVLVPAAWLLSHTGNVNAVWFAFPIAELVAVTLCAVFMRKCHRDILLPM
ncbi:MATE family efflux transporter, partial [Xanthomonas citri pv. citri]|nr:MATE family efflux transporter [Xanthomonas citri pv. citri]